MATLLAKTTGGKYGPNSYTRAEVGKITGYLKTVSCGGATAYAAKVSVTASPLRVTSATAKPDSTILPPCGISQNTVHSPMLAGPDATMQPNSWWNPFSWNWKSIMGNVWNDIFVSCAEGATNGLVGGLVMNKAVPFILRGAEPEVGPSGYAALAVGGCLINIFTS